MYSTDQDAVATATVVAFRSVGPERAGELRLRTQSLHTLRRAPRLPRVMVDAVFASGDADLLRALAANPLTDRDLLVRVAQPGRPALARTLYRFEDAERDAVVVRRAVLAAADPGDPGRRAPDGFVEWLLTQRHERLLEPALRAPFVELTAHALLCLGSDLPRGVVGERCRALRAAAGERLAGRGLLAADGGVSTGGRDTRTRVEARTDALAGPCVPDLVARTGGPRRRPARADRATCPRRG